MTANTLLVNHIFVTYSLEESQYQRRGKNMTAVFHIAFIYPVYDVSQILLLPTRYLRQKSEGPLRFSFNCFQLFKHLSTCCIVVAVDTQVPFLYVHLQKKKRLILS